MTGNPLKPLKFRSQHWFDNPANTDMTALYLERYLNYGFTRGELQGGKPIIGIAQTGSDLSPCNRAHVDLVKRIRDGIYQAGGIPIEFPVHPMQETGKRPTASLDRNLAYLSIVEVLYGYPLDGVVLTTGCDKTTPACIMAAATVDLPAIVLTSGPMLNGWYKGERVGAVAVAWKARNLLAEGKINERELNEIITSGATSVGYCNTMGTASTMNSLAEVLGMSLPYSGTIPAAYSERAQCAYRTGLRIVELVRENVRPSDILTRQAFENAIVVNTSLGGSTNAPIHINAIARHIGVEVTMEDWETIGHNVPLLLNMQPAGKYLGEDYHRAGGVPAVVNELMKGGLIHEDAMTVNGKTLGDNCRGRKTEDAERIASLDKPLKVYAGFVVLTGNLFDSAIMKLSVISSEFRTRYLSNAADPDAFEGRAIVFDGPEDYQRRIDDPALNVDENCFLVMRGTGAMGYPVAGEVVNMRAPAYLLKRGITGLPCIGDGRQSGTSGSPSILNASPEAAAGGGLALLAMGDRVRIDLKARRVDVVVTGQELEERRTSLAAAGGYKYPAHQTPWQEIQRGLVDQLSDGMTLTPAVKYQRIAATSGLPRHPIA